MLYNIERMIRHMGNQKLKTEIRRTAAAGMRDFHTPLLSAFPLFSFSAFAPKIKLN
jgi:hypothetical protein